MVLLLRAFNPLQCYFSKVFGILFVMKIYHDENNAYIDFGYLFIDESIFSNKHLHINISSYILTFMDYEYIFTKSIYISRFSLSYFWGKLQHIEK